ncbi:hypothetical protein K458DRAFT_103345 [Lentithecium fluviatile CBS 122367]|uniref:Uncharacterized protein n=1 Tax=Lentithecium fluviatile CBS 122367 TaxID=1168545 RepID=A0A6G1JIR9_9PLEO|nr:hypothetical protein K458DRAFT_103345 [Lentithecium fluviatile CBS 122367]
MTQDQATADESKFLSILKERWVVDHALEGFRFPEIPFNYMLWADGGMMMMTVTIMIMIMMGMGMGTGSGRLIARKTKTVTMKLVAGSRTARVSWLMNKLTE